MRHFLLALVCLVDTSLAEVVTSHIDNGAPEHRIDIVVMGDGFTSTEMGDFRTAAANTIDELFSEAPFSTYPYLFNVWFIDVESAESGADHPSRAVYKNTALGATYDCLDIERLICIDTGLATAVLNANVTPEQQDILLVLVNDSQYGGSGGYFAVSSVHEASGQIMQHEIGHSFGGLGDEYWRAGEGPGRGLCAIYGERDRPNISKTAERNLIPWNEGGGPPDGWIETSQPLPSPSFTDLAINDPQVINTVGAFLGGNHCDNQYRPTDSSKMRFLSVPWGPVNSDILISRIHVDSNIIESVSPSNTTLISELPPNSALTVAAAPGIPFENNVKWEKMIGSSAAPEVAIEAGTTVTSVINIEESGQVASNTFSVDIDIRHTYRGDLTIKLVSPSGTSVTLHNSSGDSDQNLIGNIPNSLNSSNTPGIPTSSDIFASLDGESFTGQWTLSVSDEIAPDDGVLNSWSINFGAVTLASGTNTLDVNQIDPGFFLVKATLSDPNPSIRMSATKRAARESVVWRLGLTATALPLTPIIQSYTAGNEEITVFFSPRINTNQADSSYTVTCRDDQQNAYSASGYSSPITVSGLTNDVAYTCTITATNSSGTSPASATTDPITPEATATGLPIWLLYQATQ